MDFIKHQFSSFFSGGSITMKFLVLAFFLLGCALAEDAPYSPSGTKPQGALLVLPTEIGSVSATRPAPQYSAPQYLAPQPQTEAGNLQKASENIMEKLSQRQGSDTGSYYVYLSDGRLQRVQYTTAPLSQPTPQGNNQQVNRQNIQAFQSSNTLQFSQQNAQTNGNFQGYNEDQRQGQYQYPQPISGQYNQQQPASGQYSPQQAASAQYSQLQDASSQLNKEQQTATDVYGKQQASGQSAPQRTNSGFYSKQLTANGLYRQQQPSEQFSAKSASNLYKQLPGSTQYRLEPTSGQYNDEAASNRFSQQVPNGSYRQQQQAKPEKLTELEQEKYPQNFVPQQDGISNQYSKVSVQSASSSENPTFTQQQQQFYYLQQPGQLQQFLQQPLAASYVASVQFTDVQPITSPVYSYSPAPLVRILRYAPMYQ